MEHLEFIGLEDAGIVGFSPDQWPFQEPIDWRYLPYIRPSFQAYVREYTHKIWPKIWYSISTLGSWNSH
jgi:hypothetical protein